MHLQKKVYKSAKCILSQHKVYIHSYKESNQKYSLKILKCVCKAYNKPLSQAKCPDHSNIW